VQQLSPEDAQAARDVFPRDDAPTQMEEQVWRIPLPLPFALRSVNVYLIGDGAGHWTLFDAGLGLARDEFALRAGLERAGVPMEALSALVLTHAHPDHIGLSGLLRQASGAPVYMLAREDERMYRVWGELTGPALRAIVGFFTEHGLTLDESAADPRVTAVAATSDSGDGRDSGDGHDGQARRDQHRRDEAARAIDRPNGFSLPPLDAIRTLENGDTLTLGRWSYQVIWTPGHSDYHMCMLRSDGFFIAGDHILPAITPNIGLFPNSRSDPLGDYYASLQRVRDLPARIVAPGHGLPFSGPGLTLAERVDALREHHIERSAAIAALVEAAPAGQAANEIASALFGERLRTVDDRRFALAETLAHLEHLRLRGRVRMERVGAFYRYLPAALGAGQASVQASPQASVGIADKRERAEP
jgi:glyoxylase-like metal-dependent hydrolase (beta-lactamase superfamily II)